MWPLQSFRVRVVEVLFCVCFVGFGVAALQLVYFVLMLFCLFGVEARGVWLFGGLGCGCVFALCVCCEVFMFGFCVF